MKKFLLVSYQGKSGTKAPEETVILEGDLRMTNRRMIEGFIGEYINAETEFTGDRSFETESGTFEITNVDIISQQEAERQRNQNRYWTYQVNKNITDPASRYSYSGRVPGA